MTLDDVVAGARRLARPYAVTAGKRFRLKSIDAGDTAPLTKADKREAAAVLQTGIRALAALQDKLYAQDRWALLLIFQAMDAAGKDSAIKHVMSGVNPQGCQVASFKAPSAEELDHDYLWRCTRRLPERGRIGIFNRSYYEEVLVVRVHPELLAGQKLPDERRRAGIWKRRFRDIRAYERHLTENGTVIRKFFLHVSRDEQRKRFLERIDDPTKNWKMATDDVRERRHWPEYMAAYQDMIRQTATPDAPWYVVPADKKWFTRIVVAAAVIEALASLDLRYPRVSRAHARELAAARQALLRE
jgi:PPK2 family polyphosphate:nucleotide phosphotransferase